MKITYPVTANYVQGWQPKRAIIELVSNMLDGSLASERPHRVDYNRKRRVLRLVNQETTLSRDALLLGETTKRESDDAIGQFGEGLKLGCLVLRRERFPVTIRNGRSETWRPEIEITDQFSKPVLVMYISKSDRQVDDFVVEIENVESELWESVRSAVLQLRSVKESKGAYGSILLDEAERGNMYVRGIFVGRKNDMNYGFNFQNVRLGRDREMPDSYDLNYGIRDVVMGTLFATSDSDDQLYDAINKESPEAEALRETARYTDVPSRLTTVFQRRHGDAAVPADTTGMAEEIRHLGFNAVIVSDSIYSLTTGTGQLPSINKLRARHGLKVVKVHDLPDLDPGERHNVERALRWLRAAGITSEPAQERRISVVDFNDDKILGTHEGENINIARGVAGNLGKLMVTLLHELAHDEGGDGGMNHQQAYERMAEACFNHAPA